ncbi:hypothetical protein CEN50_16765 [Fischerella thermalis CCMEE 5268]|uniref:Uncharacterized protein n=1 Tax=Fischerella thermalis CCMEE 5268 TaxID=2019662 RepID=A0A2N6KDM5_9CYAN|nr:hypothetical protein CEN50_16765 [Fischerella thermalis CCMEE 5268]
MNNLMKFSVKTITYLISFRKKVYLSLRYQISVNFAKSFVDALYLIKQPVKQAVLVEVNPPEDR